MAERWVLRCPSSTIGPDGKPYEIDFSRREYAEGRMRRLATDSHAGICKGPHEVVHQVWQGRHWVDVPEGDLTSEDNPVTIEP